MDYRVIRSSRKTIALQITPGGQLIVRCPKQMHPAAIECFVTSKAHWIEQKLAHATACQKLPAFTQAQLCALIQQARTVIPARVSYYAPVIGVTYERVTIRSQRSRWGSCSSKGNLNFNCLLVLVPQEVMDYVVVHELCHRKELNHSPRFWDQVACILPDYRLRQNWLKENGPSLIARLK